MVHRIGGARRKSRHHRGFALVVTVSLMVLLTLVAVGLLQLSAVSLRTANEERRMAEARANARMALMMAIGQLQEQLGPDQRISAEAGILSASASSSQVSNPHYVGVWDASAPVDGQNLDKPDYEKVKSFRSWLVSSPTVTAAQSLDLARSPAPSGKSGARLVNGAGDPSREVTVPMIQSKRFQVAWWTSDEGAKARVRAGRADDSQKLADVAQNSRIRSSGGLSVLDTKLPKERTDLSKLVSHSSLDIPGGVTSPAHSATLMHDLTVWSESVPVDVTSGQLKQDVNLRLEYLQDQNQTTRAAAGTLGPYVATDRDFRVFSWDQLRHYFSQYRDPALVGMENSSKRPFVTAHKQTSYVNSDNPETNPDATRERWRPAPVLLKMIYVVSYGTEKLAAPPNPSFPNRDLALRLYLYPVPVLWNPYNVDLVVPEFVSVASALPAVLTVNTPRETLKLDLVDYSKSPMNAQCAFGPEMPVTPVLKDVKIPAGATLALYPRIQDLTKETNYRHTRNSVDYYFWMDRKAFDCGPGNYGGVFKNLKLVEKKPYFQSRKNDELVGESGEQLTLAVEPSTTKGVLGYWASSFKIYGEHTDWHGNNGTGTDTLKTLLRFGETTSVGFRFEGGSPQVSLIAPNDLPRRTFGQLRDTPTPLMIFEIYRKPVDENLFPSKNWAFSMPSNPIHGTTSSDQGTSDRVTPWFENAYTFRFSAVNSWIEVANRMQLPPSRDDRIYFGTSYSPAGQLAAVAQEIPLGPPASLADLGCLPLFDFRPKYESTPSNPFGFGLELSFHDGRLTQFPQNHAIGNSYASPGIPPDKITQPGWGYYWYDTVSINRKHLRVDRSFVANSQLWDRWFCSSLGTQNGNWYSTHGTSRTLAEVAKGFFEETRPLPVENHVPCLDRPVATVLDELVSNGKVTENAYRLIAARLRVAGGFNVNSTSEEAWAQFLGSTFSRPVAVMSSSQDNAYPEVVPPEDDHFTVSRYALANGGPAERKSGKEREDLYWNGMRELTKEQIRELAKAIVKQVKLRGPFRSLAEFVNRRLDSTQSDLAVSGCLQSALDDAKVSINQPLRDKLVTGNETTTVGKPSYNFPQAAVGPLKQGIAGYVMQGDLLRSLGPSITVRSDTFTIRAAGQSLDASGNVVAKAWCEAVVQREADYIDPADGADVAFAALKSPVNRKFGRRLRVLSFRWLPADEV